MAQYLLSVYMFEGQEMPEGDELQAMFDAVDAFNQKLQDQGVWVFGNGLHPPETATVVREQDGDVITVDGPFAESKEHVGGFWIIEAPHLDAALGWAREATVACKGPVEVRPFQDEPEA